MFSNDRNIETIGQLVQLAKHYIGLQKEYMKLDIIEKGVKLITALILFILFSLILIAISIYLCGGIHPVFRLPQEVDREAVGQVHLRFVNGVNDYERHGEQA